MQSPNYWLDLFTGTTWNEFLQSGGDVSAFRESRWNAVKRIKPGDYLLCYLTGISRFIAVLEVQSEAYIDHTPVSTVADFPCRLKVKIVLRLAPETAVPIHEMRDELSIFQNLDNPNAWSGHVRGSPVQWKKADGEAIMRALREAEQNPVARPFDQRKLQRRPTVLDTIKIGPVVVPEHEDEESQVVSQTQATVEASKHTGVQYSLLKLGRDMGYDVWVAGNDRSREVNGRRLSEHFALKETLPLQFDDATNKTIQLIDVLWLRGNAIIAAFEIESTTSIYSGLLRMSDLIAMQPNIKIRLYLVAPDERRDKVFSEVNRPTFARLSPPLADICRYISFDTLETRLREVAAYAKYLKPEFLDELSEPCEVE